MDISGLRMDAWATACNALYVDELWKHMGSVLLRRPVVSLRTAAQQMHVLLSWFSLVNVCDNS